MHELTTDSRRGDAAAERIALVASDVVARLPVPGGRLLSAVAAEDVRADAVAAVWRAAVRDADGFLDERGEPDPGAVAAYATLCLRKGLDELRRSRRAADATLELARAVVAVDDATLERVLARERERSLADAVERLPAGAAAVVVRRRLGWSFDRIARDLGVARNTAIQRYRRALRRLPAETRVLLPEKRARGR